VPHFDSSPIIAAWHACQQNECRNKCGASHNANAAFDEHLAVFDRNHDAFLLMHLRSFISLLSSANIHNLLPRLNVPTAKIRLPSHFRSCQSSLCIDGSSHSPFVILSPFLTRRLVCFREIRSVIMNKDEYSLERILMNDNFSYSLFSTARQSAIEPFVPTYSPSTPHPPYLN